MNDREKLRVAIHAAEEGMAAGNDPYGAAIYDGEVLLVAAHNQVATTGDPVAHAEIEALRAVWSKTDPAVLARSTLYASCEPCPMCYGAIRWAGIRDVVYAAQDAGYGAGSNAAALAHPRCRHLPMPDADSLLETAKRGWGGRDPRQSDPERNPGRRQ